MAEIKKRVRLARCGTASPTHAGGENRHQSCRSSTKWTMRRRLPYWYDQLKVLEVSINANPSDNHLIERLFEIEGIQDAVSRIRFRWPSRISSTICAATSTSFGTGSRPAQVHRCGWRPNKKKPSLREGADYKGDPRTWR
jgi:hypothetical protein